MENNYQISRPSVFFFEIQKSVFFAFFILFEISLGFVLILHHFKEDNLSSSGLVVKDILRVDERSSDSYIGNDDLFSFFHEKF